MKKAKFNTMIRNPATCKFEKQEVTGYLVDESYAKVGVYKSDYGHWIVIEFYTGAKISVGKTRKEALENSLLRVTERAILAGKSTTKYVKFLADGFIASHGYANGKWYTRLVKVSKEEYDKMTSHARKEKTIVDGEGITYRIKAVGLRGVLLGVEYVGVSGGICMIKKRIRR